MIDYSSLRFQIEFTFRDAKQYWGLDDFMTTTAVGVTNAANLALFMVNLSRVLLEGEQERDPACSVLDLKARYRDAKYVRETLKMLAEKPIPMPTLQRGVGAGRAYCLKLNMVPSQRDRI